jgi:hypothetical protein
MATLPTRIEVDRQRRELTHRIDGLVVIRSANLYYVRLDRQTGSAETLMEWRKLTRERATEIGVDSRLRGRCM